MRDVNHTVGHTINFGEHFDLYEDKKIFVSCNIVDQLLKQMEQ